MGLFCRFVLVLIIAPIMLSAALAFARGWPESWHQADWSATNQLPSPRHHKAAIIRIYAAKSGRWKGIFATHHWIVLKRTGAAAYTRFEVVGWGTPVRRDNYPPDGKWYSNDPFIVHQENGPKAQKLIPQILSAIKSYPWRSRGSYQVWPGPNSNTFVACVLRKVPGLGAEMDARGIGKDYLGPGLQFATMPSGTGWQVSLNGLAGFGVSMREGIEINFLGTTLAIDFQDLAIKFPGLGKIGLL